MPQPTNRRLVTEAALPELVQDLVATEFAGPHGTGVTVAYDDTTGKLTITAAGSSLDTEAVQDIIGAMVAAAGGTYNDAAGTITLPSGGSLDTEAVRDTIGAAMIGAGYVAVTVNDAADTITVGSTTALQTALDAKLTAPTLTSTMAVLVDVPCDATTGAYPARPTLPSWFAVCWVGWLDPKAQAGLSVDDRDRWGQVPAP